MRRLVVSLVSLVVLVSIAVSAVLVWQSQSLVGVTGRANSQVLLCVNDPPFINFSSCPSVFNQSTLLEDNRVMCRVNATDVDNGSVAVSLDEYDPIEGLWVSFESGVLYLNASQDGVGYGSVDLSANDSSYCKNFQSVDQYLFEVKDINDPPVYVATIPLTTFSSGNSISPFSLFDFFSDPDYDELTFSVLGSNVVSVAIQQSTGDVVFSSSRCGTDYLLFSATDPGNLSDYSGPISVQSTCSDDSTGSSGGGGGGGSASPPCIPKWKCDEWSECFINNTRMMRCIDLNGCKAKDYLRIFWENCTYVPTCFDGVQNGDETGVDCGGSCKFCGTCFDGILNQDEQLVDCGGVCEPCVNCSDRLMNWDETGIDCGGPFCEPCATCFDGVQNCLLVEEDGVVGEVCETGIDCGGVCGECVITEVPGIIPEEAQKPLWWLFFLIVAVVVAAVLLRFFRKQIYSSIARLRWYFTRKRRKQFLLMADQKTFLLKELAKVENSLEGEDSDLSALLDALSSLIRRFFSIIFSLPFEFSPEDFAVAMKAKTDNGSLRKVFGLFFAKQQLFEVEGPKLSPLELRLFSEEFRQLIFQTSKVVSGDVQGEVTELEPKGSAVEQVRTTLYNAYLALQFEEVASAKKQYYHLLALYDRLSEKQKGAFFDDINRVFYEISYLLSWTR